MYFFKHIRYLFVLSFLSLLLLLPISGCSKKEDISRVSRTELFMGTYVEITLYDKGLVPERLEKITDEVFSLALDLEDKFNVYDPGSELNSLNLNKKMEVSEHLFELLLSAEKIRETTRGRFDVSVSPALKRAGFYEKMDKKLKKHIPDRTFSDGSFSMDVLTREVELPEDMWLDASAIAKGFIVDRMAEKLERAEVDSFLINAGGDILCRTGDDKEKWVIGLNRPNAKGILAKFILRNRAVATSGDHEKFLKAENNGTVVSHIIDPIKGEPVERNFSSVTVIADSAKRADAYATAFMLFPTDEAVRLAEKIPDLEILIVKTKNGENLTYRTAGVNKFLVNERFKK